MYWLSAVSMGCPSKLRWCDKTTDPIIDILKDEHLSWKKGEPSTDPLKECTAIDFQLKPPYFTFFKTHCNAKYLALFEDY
jgi:hypothetical protein